MLTHGPIADLALKDPEGFALAEQALNDFFPSLGFIVTLATGSRINNKYGPKYAVSKWETSVAFLATESFKDKESLAARMVQARYSGYGRFSCMAMFEFASDPANAAAGTESAQGSTNDNPPEYNSPYDRNWVLYWAALFTASIEKETGANNLDVNVLDFWKQQCEEPTSYKTPVEPSWYNTDRKRVGNQDAFLTEVDMRDFAPLISFGSLRQLRDVSGAAVKSYPEDASTNIYRQENEIHVKRFGEAQLTYTQADTGNMYGRRQLDETNEPHGRKLFMAGIIGKAISDALGTGYKNIDKQFPFDIPEMQRPHFFDDHVSRQTNHLKTMLKDVFCNPDERLDIENVVGNPPPFTDPLYDSRTVNTRKDLIMPASARDADPDRIVSSVGATTKLSYRHFSTQQWVYVTRYYYSFMKKTFRGHGTHGTHMFVVLAQLVRALVL